MRELCLNEQHKSKMLTLLNNYLHERYQSVVLNGQTSSLELVKSEVTQGSVLTPYSFLQGF